MTTCISFILKVKYNVRNLTLFWGRILNLLDSALSDFHPKSFFQVVHSDMKTTKPVLFQDNSNLSFIFWVFSSVATLEKQLFRLS